MSGGIVRLRRVVIIIVIRREGRVVCDGWVIGWGLITIRAIISSFVTVNL